MLFEMGRENAGFTENSWLLRVVNFDSLTYRDIVVPSSLIDVTNERKPISCCVGCILALANSSKADTVPIQRETLEVCPDAPPTGEWPWCVFAGRRGVTRGCTRATDSKAETPGATNGLNHGGHCCTALNRNNTCSTSGAAVSSAKDYTVVYGRRVIYCGSGIHPQSATGSCAHDRAQALSSSSTSQYCHGQATGLNHGHAAANSEQHACSVFTNRQSWRRKRVDSITPQTSCGETLSQDWKVQPEAPATAESVCFRYGTRFRDRSSETTKSSRSCDTWSHHIYAPKSTRDRDCGFSQDYSVSVQGGNEWISGLRDTRTKHEGAGCSPSQLGAVPVKRMTNRIYSKSRDKRTETHRENVGVLNACTGRVVTLYIGATDYSDSSEHAEFLAGTVHRLQTLRRQHQTVMERVRNMTNARATEGVSSPVRRATSSVAVPPPTMTQSVDGQLQASPKLPYCSDQTRCNCFQVRVAAICWMLSTYSELVNAFFACLLPSVASDAVSIVPRASTKPLFSRDSARNKGGRRHASGGDLVVATRPAFHNSSAGSGFLPLDARRNESRAPNGGFLSPLLHQMCWVRNHVRPTEAASSSLVLDRYSHAEDSNARPRAAELLHATLLLLDRGEAAMDRSRETTPVHQPLQIPATVGLALVRPVPRTVLPRSRTPARTFWRPVTKDRRQQKLASGPAHPSSTASPTESENSHAINSDYAVRYKWFGKGSSELSDRPPSLFSLCADSLSRMLIAVLPTIFDFQCSAMNGQLLCSLIDWSRVRRPPRVALTLLLVASSAEHSASDAGMLGANRFQRRISSWQGSLPVTGSAMGSQLLGVYCSCEVTQRERQSSKDEAAEPGLCSRPSENLSVSLEDIMPFRQRFPFVDMLLHRVYDVRDLFPSLPYLSAEVLMAVFCSRTLNRIDTEQQMVSLFKSWQRIQTLKRRYCSSTCEFEHSSTTSIHSRTVRENTRGDNSCMYHLDSAVVEGADQKNSDSHPVHCICGKTPDRVFTGTAHSHAFCFSVGGRSCQMTVPLEQDGGNTPTSDPVGRLPSPVTSARQSNVRAEHSALRFPICARSADASGVTACQRMRSEAAPWLHLFSCSTPAAASWSRTAGLLHHQPRRPVLSWSRKFATTCQGADPSSADDLPRVVCQRTTQCQPAGEEARDFVASDNTGTDKLLRARILQGERHLRRGPRYPASNIVSTLEGSRFAYSPEKPLSTYFTAAEILVWLHKRWRLVFIRRKRLLPKRASNGVVEQVTGENCAADCTNACCPTLLAPCCGDSSVEDLPSHRDHVIPRRSFPNGVPPVVEMSTHTGKNVVSGSVHEKVRVAVTDCTKVQDSSLGPVSTSSSFSPVRDNGTLHSGGLLRFCNTTMKPEAGGCQQIPEQQQNRSPHRDGSDESTSTAQLDRSFGETEPSTGWGRPTTARGRASRTEAGCPEQRHLHGGSEVDDDSTTGLYRGESPVSLGDLSHISLSDIADHLTLSAESHHGVTVPKPATKRRFVNRLVYASDTRWLEVLRNGPQHRRPEQQPYGGGIFFRHMRDAECVALNIAARLSLLSAEHLPKTHGALEGVVRHLLFKTSAAAVFSNVFPERSADTWECVGLQGGKTAGFPSGNLVTGFDPGFLNSDAGYVPVDIVYACGHGLCGSQQGQVHGCDPRFLEPLNHIRLHPTPDAELRTVTSEAFSQRSTNGIPNVRDSQTANLGPAAPSGIIPELRPHPHRRSHHCPLFMSPRLGHELRTGIADRIQDRVGGHISGKENCLRVSRVSAASSVRLPTTGCLHEKAPASVRSQIECASPGIIPSAGRGDSGDTGVYLSPSTNVAGTLRDNNSDITSRIPLLYLFDYNNTPHAPYVCSKKPKDDKFLFRIRCSQRALSGETYSDSVKPNLAVSTNGQPKEMYYNREAGNSWERVVLPCDGREEGWMSAAAPLDMLLHRQSSLIRLWERRLLINTVAESLRCTPKAVAPEIPMWEDDIQSDSSTRACSSMCAWPSLGVDCPCGCTKAVRQVTRGPVDGDMHAE
ncbi:hypothetical protein TGRUB_288475 [Toxoplasma gondii RUB]|uniref:Uncharacterized protein n=1 Tax=Toxoplasma gondii RUB TaxID=935652 RepID=A0A086M0Z8_TOXGO|nr:hypothetical protein TGRUB_288475 [Toxoplasma gondii RUB]